MNKLIGNDKVTAAVYNTNSELKILNRTVKEILSKLDYLIDLNKPIRRGVTDENGNYSGDIGPG